MWGEVKELKIHFGCLGGLKGELKIHMGKWSALPKRRKSLIGLTKDTCHKGHGEEKMNLKFLGRIKGIKNSLRG